VMSRLWESYPSRRHWRGSGQGVVALRDFSPANDRLGSMLLKKPFFNSTGEPRQSPHVRVGSAYPSRLSVDADMAARLLRRGRDAHY
jgi:hypothetical protein